MNICLMISLFNLAWLAFIIGAPTKWGDLVEKENGYWVKKGIFKTSTANKMIKFEKGKGLKFLIMFPIAIYLLASLYIK